MTNTPNKTTDIETLNPPDRVEMLFYTDPLCCWSWAMLPELLKLKATYGHLVSIRYCMGGLIKDWNTFSDPLNNVRKPSQMGPVWMDASQKTNLNIKYELWVNDPPSSSYPACIAVKTAELQSPDAGQAYFKFITEAAMKYGRNSSKAEELVLTAKALYAELPDIFDLSLFLRDYNNITSRNAFRNDLQQVTNNRIGRFPTITYSYNHQKLVITGYRPYQVLLDALVHIAPSLF